MSTRLYDQTFTCPDMKCQADAMMVRDALESEPGIELVQADHVAHKVRVVTANDDAEHDVHFRLAKLGFPPEDEE